MFECRILLFVFQAMKWKGIISAFFSVIAFTGCIESIIMDPGEDDLPVMVNCLLVTDSEVQTLFLQYVKGKSVKDYVPVTDAKVYITAVFTTVYDTLHFHYSGENRWKSQNDPGKRITAGKRYRLTVEIPGREIISAETVSPIAYRPYLYTDLHEVNSMDLHTVYYQIRPLPSEKQDLITSAVWIFAKGRLKTLEDCDEYYPYIVTDHPYADDFNINGRKFSSLPINGDFDAHTMAVTWPAFLNMRRMMPELPLHDEFVRIEHLDTERFHILAGPLEYPARGPHQDYFLFSFVSDEYDEYLRRVYVKNRKLENDITSIYSTDNMYTNIEGGVGIFGSVTYYRVGFLTN